jgi:hypothetical protein
LVASFTAHSESGLWPVTSRFMQVDMTIRGDPFWIGQGTYEDAIDHSKTGASMTSIRVQLAYNMMGQQCFLFRFKYPVDTEESGGIVLKDNETVTGIYKVTTVTNTLSSGGQFTQELHGVRLPLFDVFKSILASGQHRRQREGGQTNRPRSHRVS